MPLDLIEALGRREDRAVSAEETPVVPPPSLRDEIAKILASPETLREARATNPDDIAQAYADKVMTLLNERGHYLPGCPPAAEILRDAKSFAERLTLTTLALRILNMLAWSEVETPETKPARKFVDDYLEGRNHGPVGKPMLWPSRLPGLAQLLRDWGFEPTPTKPRYVARSLPNPTVQ